MRKKHRRLRRELTAFGNGPLERGLMYTERRPMAEITFSLPAHTINQAKNPAITPEIFRSIYLSSLLGADNNLLSELVSNNFPNNNGIAFVASENASFTVG